MNGSEILASVNKFNQPTESLRLSPGALVLYYVY